MSAISQIIIKDIPFFGYHGVYPEENVTGTAFRADLIIDIDSGLPGFETDEIEDTVNYEDIIRIVLDTGTQKTFKLVEKLAQTIATEILAIHHVLAVDITIYKSVKTLTPEPQWIAVRRKINKQRY